MLIAVLALLLFVMLTAMYAAVRVRAHRTAVLAAEAENTASFARAGTFAEAAVNGGGGLDWDSEYGWETPPPNTNATDWLDSAGDPCVFDSSYSCWQARLGPVVTTPSRGGLSHNERVLSVRVIADCKDPGGYRRPARGDPDERLASACKTVESSETRYRQRSFLQYGLHFSSQALPPGQQRFLGGGQSPYSLITGPLAAAFGTRNVHTNEVRPQICLVDGEPDWLSGIATASGVVERISSPLSSPFEDVCGSPPGTAYSPNQASELRVSAVVEPDRATSVSPACLTDPSERLASPTRAALPYEPRWTRTGSGLTWMAMPFGPPYGPKPNPLGTGADWVSPPEWMLPAFLTAGGHPNPYSPNAASPPNPAIQVVDLANLGDGEVVASLWELRVHGQAPAGVSATVVSAGTIIIDPDPGASATVGGTSGDGIVALITACDIIIDIDPSHLSAYDDPSNPGTLASYDDSNAVHRSQVPFPVDDIMPWYCQAAAHSAHPWCTGPPSETGDGALGVGITGTLPAPNECNALIAAHTVTLKNVALLAPHGGVFARAAQCAHGGVPPTLVIEGSLASGYFGAVGFQNPTAATRARGYVLRLKPPDGPLEMHEWVPAWWPDTLGGEWQPLG